MNREEREKVVTISLNLQEIAAAIADTLREASGEPLGFVLVVSVGKTAQYISNASRADGMSLLEFVLKAWKDKRADIPAHYNPDLMPDEPH